MSANSPYRNRIAETKAAENSGHNIHNVWKDRSMEDRLAYCQKESFPFQVMALSVEGDLNVGTIIRSASLMGAEKAIVFGRRKFDGRGMVGVQNYIDIEKVAGLEDQLTLDSDKFFDYIDINGLYPVVIEQHPTSQLLNEFVWPEDKKICLVVGNESDGIPKSILDRIVFRNEDEKISRGAIVEIPQRGVLRSFNVATAATLVMWQLRMAYNYL